MIKSQKIDEIESIILRHPKVAQVKVIKEGNGLKATLSLKESATFKEIIDWCYEKLGRRDIPIEIKGRPYALYELLLGIKEINIQKDYISMTMPYRKEITNIHGIIHGGAISSLADNAMAVLVTINYGPCYTKKIEIEFFEPAKSDLLVEAKIIKKKLNLCICEADIKDKESRLIAKASAKILVR